MATAAVELTGVEVAKEVEVHGQEGVQRATLVLELRPDRDHDTVVYSVEDQAQKA